jgi:hypothetical protein
MNYLEKISGKLFFVIQSICIFSIYFLPYSTLTTLPLSLILFILFFGSLWYRAKRYTFGRSVFAMLFSLFVIASASSYYSLYLEFSSNVPWPSGTQSGVELGIIVFFVAYSIISLVFVFVNGNKSR